MSTTAKSLLQFWLGLLALILFASGLAYCQTRCHHQPSTLAYWEQIRLIPAQVQKLDGDELTLKVEDKTQVKVFTLYLEPATRFYKVSVDSFENTTREDFTQHPSGFFLFIYCQEHKTVKEVHRKLE